MPPIFTLEQRDEMKEKLLKIGIDLMCSIGIRKTSISKITTQAGIAKGTFYNFFESKERFVVAAIDFSKESIYKAMNEIVERKGFIDKENFLWLLNNFSFGSNHNIFNRFTDDDIQWIHENCADKYMVNAGKEDTIMQQIFQHMKGLRKDINYHMVANLMKNMAFLSEHRHELHEDAFDETQLFLRKSLCDYLFEEV